MEISAAYHAVILGEDDGIVCHRVDLDLEDSAHVRERVARCAVHLGYAANGVRILYPRIADPVGCHIRASGHERPQIRGDRLLAGVRPGRMKVSVPGAVRGTQRLGGHGAHHVGGRREHLGVVKREAPDRGHDLGSVDQRDALLRAELDGLEASRFQRVRPTLTLALVDRLALADQHERRVREWREVPGCADAAVPRYRGVHAPIDHVAEKVDDLGPHTGSAGRQRVGAEHEDRPHDVLRKRRPDADGVAAHEIALQGAQLVVRNTHGREVAESGVDAVHGIVGLSDLGDDPRGLLHLTLRGSVEAHRDVAARDRDDVGDREVAAGEPEGRYFTFSRYHRARSA